MLRLSGKNIMSTTEPIRDKQKLLDFKNYYLNEKLNLRNYTIIILGLNTAAPAFLGLGKRKGFPSLYISVRTSS